MGQQAIIEPAGLDEPLDEKKAPERQQGGDAQPGPGGQAVAVAGLEPALRLVLTLRRRRSVGRTRGRDLRSVRGPASGNRVDRLVRRLAAAIAGRTREHGAKPAAG